MVVHEGLIIKQSQQEEVHKGRNSSNDSKQRQRRKKGKSRYASFCSFSSSLVRSDDVIIMIVVWLLGETARTGGSRKAPKTEPLLEVRRRTVVLRYSTFQGKVPFIDKISEEDS